MQLDLKCKVMYHGDYLHVHMYNIVSIGVISNSGPLDYYFCQIQKMNLVASYMIQKYCKKEPF